MSYILDALKKADAERERGSVPGLHSQPLAPAPDDDPDEPQRPQVPILWIAAGAGLCLIGVLSWQLLMRPSAPVSADSAPNDAPAQVNAPVVQPPVAQVEVPHAMPDAAPYSTPAPTPEPVHQERARSAEPVARTAPRTQQPRPAEFTPPARTPDAQVPALSGRAEPSNDSSRNGKQTPQANNANQRIPTLQELPDDVRREIPQLTIGGAMYSETPASRMLIINSQVFHEGDKPYQGLALEEIRLKSAVFSYRGYRYLVNY